MIHRAKILIVEDDELIRRIYRQIFELRGYIVAVAANGQEGLKRAKGSKYALILLDIMMPKLDGISMLRKLKALPTGRQTPVIVLTNLVGAGGNDAALAAGALKCVYKSDYSPKDVVDLVEDLLAPDGDSVQP